MVVLSLIALTGCLRQVETPFPDGIAPWEDNTAPAPAALPGEKYPEQVVFVAGEHDDYLWLHGRGYVHSDVAMAWAAVQEPAVVANRRGVDEWAVRWDVETGFDVSFAMDNTVRDILTVEWTNTWRQAVVDGTLEEPEVVGVRYQKTEGAAIIDLMRGSIVLRETEEPDRTEVELIEHLGAPSTNEDDLRCYQQDLFDEIVLFVQGEPLAEYDASCR